jgi:hypothetical protein
MIKTGRTKNEITLKRASWKAKAWKGSSKVLWKQEENSRTRVEAIFIVFLTNNIKRYIKNIYILSVLLLCICKTGMSLCKNVRLFNTILFKVFFTLQGVLSENLKFKYY